MMFPLPPYFDPDDDDSPSTPIRSRQVAAGTLLALFLIFLIGMTFLVCLS